MGVSSLLRSSFGLALFVVTCAVLVRAVVGGHKEKSVAIGGGAGRHDRHHDHPVQEHMCGSVNPSREEEEQDLEQMKEWKRHFTSHPSTRRRLQEYGSVEINLHYHVFRRADNSEDISDEVLMEQFRVLNDSFANTPFKFVLQPINRYDNDEWADYDFRSQAESNNFAITKDLRIGGPDALNIYFNQGICETVAGFASFPLNDGYYPNGSYSPHDGIWMCSMTLPGSYMSPEGKILVHELGHWFGLYHVFEGNSCDASNPGDFIDDTPQMASHSSGCPTERDSCPNSDGLDPIHNFMDYTADDCKTEFTAGQVSRMYAQMDLYRRKLNKCDVSQTTIDLDFHFDENPKELTASYINWETGKSYKLIGDTTWVDFAGKRSSHSMCKEANVLSQLELKDERGGGIGETGSFKFKLNGFEVGGNFEFQWRLFYLVDVFPCPQDHGRFRLWLQFDQKQHHIKWNINAAASGETIMNHQSTSIHNSDIYYANYRGQPLLVEKCLRQGEYSFHIEDRSSQGPAIASPGYYQLSLDDKPIFTGGGDDGFKGGASEITQFTVGVPLGETSDTNSPAAGSSTSIPTSSPISFLPTSPPTVRTSQPSHPPSTSPSTAPTQGSSAPSYSPTVAPSTSIPTSSPITFSPTSQPTVRTSRPSHPPSTSPSSTPTQGSNVPSNSRTIAPSTSIPTNPPVSFSPTYVPTSQPSNSAPSAFPSSAPSQSSNVPSKARTFTPSLRPSPIPSNNPYSNPSHHQSRLPSFILSSRRPVNGVSDRPLNSPIMPVNLASNAVTAFSESTNNQVFPGSYPSDNPSRRPNSEQPILPIAHQSLGISNVLTETGLTESPISVSPFQPSVTSESPVMLVAAPSQSPSLQLTNSSAPVISVDQIFSEAPAALQIVEKSESTETPLDTTTLPPAMATGLNFEFVNNLLPKSIRATNNDDAVVNAAARTANEIANPGPGGRQRQRALRSRMG